MSFPHSEMSVNVPESTQTHLDQTIKNWPLGQTLVISAGIHPGFLDKKGGWFNLRIPGTYPTGTEVLVFLDAETVTRAKAASRNADTTIKSSRVDGRSSRSRNSEAASVDEEKPPRDE